MCSKSDQHQGARKKKKSEENGVIPKKLIKKLNDKSKSNNCPEAFESFKSELESSVAALYEHHDRVHLLSKHHDSVHLPPLPGGETGGNRTYNNNNNCNKGGNTGNTGRAGTSFPATQELRWVTGNSDQNIGVGSIVWASVAFEPVNLLSHSNENALYHLSSNQTHTNLTQTPVQKVSLAMLFTLIYLR